MTHTTFLSAAQPTDQGEESVILVVFVVVVGGFGGDCFPISNIHSKWVHPEKTFLQNGCIQRKLFFTMGAFTKTFAAKLMHQDKTLLQNGCIKSLSFT